jgi:hypothetical protein
MDDIEERILSYPHLFRDRQREIEAYVEKNPEWAPLLRDVRSVEDLSANLRADLPSDTLLTTYVMVQHLDGNGDMSPQLRKAFDRMEAHIEKDDALRREVEAAQRRLTEAEAAIDPVFHFETLTEHELEVEPGPDETEGADAVGSTSESAPSPTPSWKDVLWGLPRLVRRGLAVAVILTGVYGGLYGLSLTTQSTLNRLAALDISDQVVDNYANARMRSATPEASSPVDEEYVEALSLLEDARVSTLGLFPRYDPDRLAQAEQHLETVLERAAPDSFLALEAHFYLGKIALAQEDIDAARSHFKTVVQREGRQTQEAHEILKTLQQEYGGPGS